MCVISEIFIYKYECIVMSIMSNAKKHFNKGYDVLMLKFFSLRVLVRFRHTNTE